MAQPSTRATKRPRKQGRPRRSGAQVGRDIIVKRTRDLLTGSGPGIGPERLSLREIARSLGVDPGLIRYYFGDKTGLFITVVQEVLAENRARHQAFLRSDLSVADKIRERVKVYLDIIGDNPYLHRLIVDLILYGDTPATARFRQEMVARAYSELKQLIDQSGAEVGGKPVDARFLHVALLGMTEYFIVGGPLVDEMFAREKKPADLRARYAAFLGNMLVAGLGLKDGRAK
ncbi:MAG: TetR/AcrR family transcriptional regulator [Alphaproteobacteria bacterium]